MSIVIRCHPCSAVTTGELEGWLEAQVERLRDLVTHGAIRLLRVSGESPSGREPAGWLVEIDLRSDREDPAAAGALANVVRDMRILGLQPAILEPAPAPVSRQHVS